MAKQRAMKAARAAAAAACIAAVLAAGHALPGILGDRLDGGGAARLEEAVRDAAVSCYATEGRYPDSLDYLTENYGLRPDGRYHVHYRIFAPNLPPDIAAVPKGDMQ